MSNELLKYGSLAVCLGFIHSSAGQEPEAPLNIEIRGEVRADVEILGPVADGTPSLPAPKPPPRDFVVERTVVKQVGDRMWLFTFCIPCIRR